MTQCKIASCSDPADGWFLPAPGVFFEGLDLHEHPELVPVPLCHWHSLLMGDERTRPPHITFLDHRHAW